MGIFENFDQTTWILFGLLIAAVIAYYFWPESTKAQAEVRPDEDTRKKARALIAVAADDVDKSLFDLSHLPLRVKAGAKLKSAIESGEKLDPQEVREALWVQQRAMITRLESEIDYAQQADVSENFGIAAPANQPASLLEKTLKELEETEKKIRSLLKVPADRQLWYGRALVLMMSNRRLFDHVAWLTGAGLAASAPGAFVVSEDDIVMISIYATRLGGFSRPLTLQVARAAILGVGGPATPKWLEYGMAHWVTNKLLGKPQLAKDEQEPAWNSSCLGIFDESKWEKAADDSIRLEDMVASSALFMEHAMGKRGDDILKQLNELRAMPADGRPQAFAWAKQLGESIPEGQVAVGQKNS